MDVDRSDRSVRNMATGEPIQNSTRGLNASLQNTCARRRFTFEFSCGDDVPTDGCQGPGPAARSVGTRVSYVRMHGLTLYYLCSLHARFDLGDAGLEKRLSQRWRRKVQGSSLQPGNLALLLG